jgi:hypothetical protein
MTNIMLIDTLASPSMCVSEILLNFVDVISFSNKIFQVLYVDDSVSAYRYDLDANCWARYSWDLSSLSSSSLE